MCDAALAALPPAGVALEGMAAGAPIPVKLIEQLQLGALHTWTKT